MGFRSERGFLSPCIPSSCFISKLCVQPNLIAELGVTGGFITLASDTVDAKGTILIANMAPNLSIGCATSGHCLPCDYDGRLQLPTTWRSSLESSKKQIFFKSSTRNCLLHELSATRGLQWQLMTYGSSTLHWKSRNFYIDGFCHPFHTFSYKSFFSYLTFSQYTPIRLHIATSTLEPLITCEAIHSNNEFCVELEALEVIIDSWGKIKA